MIIDFIAALSTNLPFKLAWKRVRHIRNGHPYEQGTTIDTLHSEAHPHSDKEYIYTIHIRNCNECGLTYLDKGLETRK